MASYAGGNMANGYPAVVEDDETADFSRRPFTASSQRPRSVHDAVEEGSADDHDGDIMPLRSRQPWHQQEQQQRYVDTRDEDDLRCLNKMLQLVELKSRPPVELQLPFYHATVVQDRSSLTDETGQKASEFVEVLRRISFDCDGSGKVMLASIGELDPSCRSPNKFLQYANSIPRQFELAYQRSGVLFICLGEGQADQHADCWLPLLADDGMLQPPPDARRAEVVFVFLDEQTAQKPLLRNRGYRVEALLSGTANLAAMLKACLPRQIEWQTNQERRLQQWRYQQALELLMEEREQRHQQELSRQQLLRSLQEQRSAHESAAAPVVAPSHGDDSGRGGSCGRPLRGSNGRQAIVVDGFGGGSTPPRQMRPLSHSWMQSQLGSPGSIGSASQMPTAQDLVKLSCTQQPVKNYYEGVNWKHLCQFEQSGIILLYGLPGVGKTQTALRYAEFIRQQKPLVFIYLFHFDTPEAFATDMNLLGEQLGAQLLSPAMTLLHDQFCSLIHALKSPLYGDVHKVLILDGADANRFSALLGKTSLLETLLDRRPDFLFLLTSASCQHYEAVHADSFALLEIEPLSPGEVEHVMQRDVHFGKYADLPALASRLRTELCGLPLGIFPALAYMRRTLCTFDGYLRLLDDPDDVADLSVRSPSHQPTVRQAIRLAVNELLDRKRQHSHSEATTVLLVACFARQELPTELLRSCLSLRSVQSCCDDDDEDGQPRVGTGGGSGYDVNEIVSDLKVTCLFENGIARYMDVPLVTVHKVVHDVMLKILVTEPAARLDEALDLALRGAFVEVEIDTRQRRSREHAILLHPHILHVTAMARKHHARLADRPCAKLCLAYLLQAAAYWDLESGKDEAAVATSAAALDCLCELLETTRSSMLAARRRIDAAAADGGGSFDAGCPLVRRLDALARSTRMSRLVCKRRSHVTTKEWPARMTSEDYARMVRELSAIDSAKLDAIFPYELLAAVLYMHGRALKRSDLSAAGDAYRLCLHLCEYVHRAHGGTRLIYELLAQRSGMRCLHPAPASAGVDRAASAAPRGDCSGLRTGESEALWLQDIVSRFKQLASTGGQYFQMGLLKLQPGTDDLHQLLCRLEIVRCMRRLHQLAATTGGGCEAAPVSFPPSRPSAEPDVAGARVTDAGHTTAVAAEDDCRTENVAASAVHIREMLAIQRESFAHGLDILKLAKEMDASLRGPCYIEYGHLTLQMLPQNGAAHSVSYYGDGLAEFIKAGIPTRVAFAVRQIVDCHLDLGRVPSDELFTMVRLHLDMLRGSCVASHVSEARACVDSLQAVYKIYQVLKIREEGPGKGIQRLKKAFGTVAPQVACRANSTMEEEQAYAWHEAVRSIGYSDAGIMKECRLLLLNERPGEMTLPVFSPDEP